jgi:putative endonuclease
VNQAGQQAEDRALAFLLRRGLLLLERNWRCRGGELDLVMRDNGLLVFVEVRYRASMKFGGAVASITPAKCQRLQFAGASYLQSRGWSLFPCRFDAVVNQLDGRLTWLKNILA